MKDGIPLPPWAPADPSPEFLRAARLMQPIRESPTVEPDLRTEAASAHFQRTLVAGWELLGSLSEEQLAKLVSAREVRLPVRSLTAKQRDLLERYFQVWRREMRSVPGEPGDVLVQLYKTGARQDLSNVTLTFRIRGSNRVAAFLDVTRPDGSEVAGGATGLGDYIERGKGRVER